MKKRCLACILTGMLLVSMVPSQAAIPVIDVAAIAKLIDQIITMKNQLSEMVAINDSTWREMRQTYENAKWLFNKNQWKAAIDSWRYPTYRNVSGRTVPWDKSAKDATAAVGGVIAVASRLPGAIHKYNSFVIDEAKSKDFAKIEIMDGTSVNTLEAIGGVRQYQASRELAVAKLQGQMESTSGADNTQMAALNLIGGASMAQIRYQQDLLRLTTQQTDILLQQQLRERDAMAEAMTREQAFLAGHKSLTKSIYGGTTAVLKAYKGF